MRFLSFLLINCLNCSHYTPLYIENTWELSACKNFKNHTQNVPEYAGLSMDLACI